MFSGKVCRYRMNANAVTFCGERRGANPFWFIGSAVRTVAVQRKLAWNCVLGLTLVHFPLQLRNHYHLPLISLESAALRELKRGETAEQFLPLLLAAKTIRGLSQWHGPPQHNKERNQL